MLTGNPLSSTRFSLSNFPLLQHDTNAEAAAQARASFASFLPQPDKRAAALCIYGGEVLSFVREVLESTPQSLGDPKKETPEELADRSVLFFFLSNSYLCVCNDCRLPCDRKRKQKRHIAI
jgi:hypothetical protein